MRQILEIPGRLPGMNEIIDSSKALIWKRGKKRVYQYTQDKRWFSGKIAQLCALQQIKPMSAVVITVIFKEKRIARDPDNIIAGIKFILDGLVKSGVLVDDSIQFVKGLSFRFQSGCDENSIHITLEGD